MALDSMQKRQSAVLIGMAFRTALVDPTEASFTQGNRQAAAWEYSGIAASGAPGEAAAGLRGKTPVYLFCQSGMGGI